MGRFENWLEVMRTCNLPEGGAMDIAGKWLIIVRACILPLTLLSALLGGLLAALDGYFHLAHWLLAALGLLLAHAANNMINDLFDTFEGVDTKDYARAKYAPHPLLDGLVSRKGLVAAIALCTLGDFLIAVYLTRRCGWPVMALAVAGLLASVCYVAPPVKLKHRGLGEATEVLIWGPLMIGGTYFVIAGTLSGRVWLAALPYGLAVATGLMGKHIDKLDQDRAKGIRTLPVLLGERRARQATQAMVWAFYLTVAALVAGGDLHWASLLVLASLPHANRLLVALHQPVPETAREAFAMVEDVIPRRLRDRFDPSLPLEAYPLWPLWFVVWGVWWTRWAGGLLAAGLFIGLILRGAFGL